MPKQPSETFDVRASALFTRRLAEILRIVDPGPFEIVDGNRIVIHPGPGCTIYLETRAVLTDVDDVDETERRRRRSMMKVVR